MLAVVHPDPGQYRYPGPARMAELADAGGLNPPAFRGLWVQIPLRALKM